MQKPEKDEIEVSIFGPGYGECIVIHIGNNEWVVIDCILFKFYGKHCLIWKNRFSVLIKTMG